ncbi:MAG TPA: hypothetical protein VFZ98_05730 [Vicinamibacterales bacterium]
MRQSQDLSAARALKLADELGLRYDSTVVPRRMRLVSGLVVAALALSPFLTEWCAANCETARQGGVPACHHVATPAQHIEPDPRPCGHDHRALVIEATSVTLLASRARAIQSVGLNEPRFGLVRQLPGNITLRGPTLSLPSLDISPSLPLRI